MKLNDLTDSQILAGAAVSAFFTWAFEKGETLPSTHGELNHLIDRWIMGLGRPGDKMKELRAEFGDKSIGGRP